ncbi:MAG: magnesium transporter [Solobacterium sp.]|jgi:magnesium transporter|nr:magnesium transporter [Solobacterium sp.]MCH4206645.1 magnesium transporter [Solobacterium sp.]MCH4228065.1 magnesium transporter [Solobacterium sp.]MCH4283497.1 magnesium transporter [Solobacterium sp.]
MEEKDEKALETFRVLLKEKKFTALRGMAQNMNESDLAAIMEEMEDEDMLKMFRLFPKDLAADVFSQLETDSQQYIITSLSEREAGIVIDNLYTDDAADLLEEMPASVVKKILANARPDTRKDINHLLQYPDDSAGSVMTVEFVDLRPEMTVDDAMARLRQIGMDSETINICYVLNDTRKLVGTVALRYLILNQRNEKIGDIMHEDVVSCNTSTDQEHVAQIFKKYDFTALPVVDHENRMVGIITVDDVMDIMEQEATEDIDRMNAIIPSDKPYLKNGVFETWKKRIPWLLLLMISATFTGKIITGFESALSKVVILTAYIPMLMDTGGNAGSQASVEVVRGLSLEEVHFNDFFKVVWKEMRVGLLCGITLAAAIFCKCIFFDAVSVQVAAVVCITVICAVFFSKLIACTLVLLVQKIGLDPAVVASPVLTTIIDALSLIIYFTVATNILHI